MIKALSRRPSLERKSAVEIPSHISEEVRKIDAEITDEVGEQELVDGYLYKFEAWSDFCFAFEEGLQEEDYCTHAESQTDKILGEWKQELTSRGYSFIEGGFDEGSGIYGLTWAIFKQSGKTARVHYVAGHSVTDEQAAELLRTESPPGREDADYFFSFIFPDGTVVPTPYHNHGLFIEKLLAGDYNTAGRMLIHISNRSWVIGSSMDVTEAQLWSLLSLLQDVKINTNPRLNETSLRERLRTWQVDGSPMPEDMMNMIVQAVGSANYLVRESKTASFSEPTKEQVSEFYSAHGIGDSISLGIDAIFPSGFIFPSGNHVIIPNWSHGKFIQEVLGGVSFSDMKNIIHISGNHWAIPGTPPMDLTESQFWAVMDLVSQRKVWISQIDYINARTIRVDGQPLEDTILQALQEIIRS